LTAQEIEYKAKMKIIKKIEVVYNGIIKRYIERNDLRSRLPPGITYYPLNGEEAIAVFWNNGDTGICFRVDYYNSSRLEDWFYLKFTKDGKFKDAYYYTDPYLQYGDFVYAYKRLKELSLMLL
jgi:hypothetical protein